MIRVCPSTNPCPEDKLVEYVKELQSLGVEMLHCDVMDGNFVPSKCLSLELLKKVSKNTLMALDVHLMISNPKAQVKNYLTLPLSYLTIHYEAFENKKDMLSYFKKSHKEGLAKNIPKNVENKYNFCNTHFELWFNIMEYNLNELYKNLKMHKNFVATKEQEAEWMNKN